MPAIENAIVALAKASPAITAIIGANAARLYPDTIPQAVTYPAAAYQRISVTRISRVINTQRPQPGTTRTLGSALVQITIHAKSASDRAALGEAIRESFVGFSGNIGGVFVGAILPPSERDAHNGETGIFERQQDFTIHYNET